MSVKSVYALQPYKVGNKKGGSLAVIIPKEVVQECNVTTSTILTLRVSDTDKTFSLQMVKPQLISALGEPTNDL